jgi:hypothetical protein
MVGTLRFAHPTTLPDGQINFVPRGALSSLSRKNIPLCPSGKSSL